MTSGTKENSKAIETVFENGQFVCPFRTRTLVSQMTQSMTEQVVMYPECQYGQCPFYYPAGRTPAEKCMRIGLESY